MPRGGVVRDPAIWERVLLAVGADAIAAGLVPHRVIRSPIAGGDGNVEFLAELLCEGGNEMADYLRSTVEAVRAG